MFFGGKTIMKCSLRGVTGKSQEVYYSKSLMSSPNQFGKVIPFEAEHYDIIK